MICLPSTGLICFPFTGIMFTYFESIFTVLYLFLLSGAELVHVAVSA